MKSTRYHDSDTLDRKLLSTVTSTTPSYTPAQIGDTLNTLEYLLSSKDALRIPFSELDDENHKALEAYERAHASLTQTPQPQQDLPYLQPQNRLRIRDYARRWLQKHTLSFADLDIPNDRYRTSFSDPQALLETANQRQQEFYEKINDAIYLKQLESARSQAAQPFTATNLSDEDVVELTHSALADRDQYLVFHQLQLDADYIAAAALHHAQREEAEKRASRAGSLRGAWKNWHSEKRFEKLSRRASIYSAPEETRRRTDEQLEGYAAAAQIIYGSEFSLSA